MPFYFDPVYDYESSVSYTGSHAPVEQFDVFPDTQFGAVPLNDHKTQNWNSWVTLRGRRNRALAHLARYQYRKVNGEEHHVHWFSESWGGFEGKPVVESDHRLTFREVLAQIPDSIHQYLAQQTFRHSLDRKLTAIPDGEPASRDPEVAQSLHDLALMIRRDLKEAIDAENGDGWYPGVDSDIEPVTDEHVALVTWATQRELLRERRTGPTGKTLPAYPLESLRPAIQRAFAERRRLRYAEWGITHENWEQNEFSIWNIPDDDWLPPWAESANRA